MNSGQQCNIVGEQVERHILIAVDASENAKRAVLFVSDFFGCYTGIRVTLLNVILDPDRGFFRSDEDYENWKVKEQARAEEFMGLYRNMLVEAGFAEDKVTVRIELMRGTSVAECIIKEVSQLKCCTVVIGRRGISQKEEFIFGSTSNRILRGAQNCAVMVIE